MNRNSMKTAQWFTADTHLNHAKIIGYCRRPFTCVEEMDEAMIKNWNDRVGKGDTVYHLGDFAFAKSEGDVKRYLGRLHGQVHLILGNHDRKRIKFLSGFASVKDYDEINIEGQKIVLMHYAMTVWNGSHHGSWSLYGHSHGTLPRNFNRKQFDVGVDCWEFCPLSFEKVKEEMDKHSFVPVDHHGSKERGW